MVTISQLAKKLGKNKSTVSRHARRLGLGAREGREVRLTDAEVRRLAGQIATSRPGNPNLNTRNDLGLFQKIRKS